MNVTIKSGTYVGCFGTITRAWSNHNVTEVYMPPQPTRDGRCIRFGTNWLFKPEEIQVVTPEEFQVGTDNEE